MATLVELYEEQARGCIELAEKKHDEPTIRDALLKMARDWMRDAEASPVRVRHAQPGSAVSVGRVRRGEICPTFRRVGLRYDQVTVIAESGGWYLAQDLTNTLRFVVA